MNGGPSTEIYVPPPRKYKLGGLTRAQTNSITQYREKFGKYLEAHNNTRSYEVWKIYDHIAAELLRECLDTTLDQAVEKDLEKWLVEQVIVDEFQLGV